MTTRAAVRHVILRSLTVHDWDDVSAAGVAAASAYASVRQIHRHVPALRNQLTADMGDRPVSVWGIPRGPHDRFRKLWEHIGRHDVVLFSGGNRIFAWSKVLARTASSSLAGVLWPPRQEGERYPFLIFVDRFRDTDISYPTFNRLVGYKPGHVIQSFDVLGGVVSARIIEAFGLADE